MRHTLGRQMPDARCVHPEEITVTTLPRQHEGFLVVGGSTVVIDVGGLRFVSDPTFDNPTEVLDNLPQSISTPELNIDLPEGSNGHQVIEELAAKAKFEGATEIITIDGLRVEFPDGFGLMRASNTTPILVLRFEADSDEAIGRIQNQFKAVIESNPALKWPL